MKNSLRELLKKEDKLLEDLDFADFDYNQRDIESAGDNMVRIKDKLRKVRNKIITALEEELKNRKGES